MQNVFGAMSAEFIGREDELASIEAFLKRSEQAPSALVLLGEAGIGKTALWQMGVERARERRARVLSVRAVETEAALSFLGLSDLLAGVVDEVLPSLTAPRRRALQVALLLAEPGRDAPDPRAIGLAVLDSLRALAAAGAVVVAVDDLQWFDRSSAAVLQIALRRLRGEPVGFLATARPWPQQRSGMRSIAGSRRVRSSGSLSVRSASARSSSCLGTDSGSSCPDRSSCNCAT